MLARRSFVVGLIVAAAGCAGAQTAPAAPGAADKAAATVPVVQVGGPALEAAGNAVENEAGATREPGEEGRMCEPDDEDCEQAGLVGLVGVLGGCDPADPLCDDDALAGLIGSTAGDAFGAGGLGLTGTGTGGGGIGLGSIGTLGHGSGTGFGAAGTATGIGTAGPTPTVSTVTPAANGSLPPEVIQRVVRAHVAEVRRCYEQELKRAPDASYKLVVRFVIGATGSVTSVTTDGNAPASLKSCVYAAVGRWSFPAPTGGVVSVSYPFVFSSGG